MELSTDRFPTFEETKSTELKFKQTKIGFTPREWKLCKLGDVLEKIIGGGTPSRANKEYWDGDIPWVTVKDFASFSRNSSQEYITKKGLSSSATHLIPKSTLITATRMALGKAIIYDVDVSINQDLKALFPTKALNTNYLYFWFQKNCSLIENLGCGSTVMGINLQQLNNLQFIVPPLAEQKAIATALSDMDSYIAGLEKLIAKKRLIKQGMMQKLLTPKPDWEVKKLGEVAKIVRGASPRPIESPIWFDERSSIGWVRISDVTKSTKYLLETSQKLSNQGVKASRYVGVNNLVMSICATIGRPIITKISVCIHDGFVVFQNISIEMDFLYYYLCFIEKKWYEIGQTGSQMNLNTSIIGSTPIAFPTNKEDQLAICSCLHTLDSEIESQEKKLVKAQQIKQGMMQQLLTGKIRLLNNNE